MYRKNQRKPNANKMILVCFSIRMLKHIAYIEKVAMNCILHGTWANDENETSKIKKIKINKRQKKDKNPIHIHTYKKVEKPTLNHSYFVCHILSIFVNYYTFVAQERKNILICIRYQKSLFCAIILKTRNTRNY